MTNLDKQTIGLAAKIYERSGFPSLVAGILLFGTVYGLYFVMRYEVFFTRSKAKTPAGSYALTVNVTGGSVAGMMASFAPASDAAARRLLLLGCGT